MANIGEPLRRHTVIPLTEPGATVEGDLEKVVWKNFMGENPIYGGVYAYAECALPLMRECVELKQVFEMSIQERCFVLSCDNVALKAIGLVRGTVKLWGEVIEHETGWRAQYAKLASIEEVWAGDIDEGRSGIVKVNLVVAPYYASLSL